MGGGWVQKPSILNNRSELPYFGGNVVYWGCENKSSFRIKLSMSAKSWHGLQWHITQSWSWYDYPLPSYSVFVCWYVTWPGDLDLWPFDLEQLSYMAGHVHNPATEFEDLTTIRSWVTSYNGSHWLALKMRTRPLRMRRITWPVSRGSKTITCHTWLDRRRVTVAFCQFWSGSACLLYQDENWFLSLALHEHQFPSNPSVFLYTEIIRFNTYP